jgi:hypothetical protein
VVVDAVLDRVPAVVERVQRELVLARFIGKLAVDQGVRELRERVEGLIQATGPEPSDGDQPTAPPAAAGRTNEDVATVADHGAEVEVPDAAALALEDYDELPAAHIVAKLPALDPDEREQIAAYERANRNRRTVLSKVARLAEGPT